MKVLINIPYLKFKGGVANHYLGLRDYWTEDVRYNQIGMAITDYEVRNIDCELI